MTEVQTTTLEGLMRQQSGSTGVVEGGEAVVLARTNGGETVEVYRMGVIRPYAPDTAATALAEPGRQVGLLREALLLVDHLRRQAVDRQERQTAEFHDVLGRVRDYAIARYEDGGICHDGLNEFLRAFGLPEYD